MSALSTLALAASSIIERPLRSLLTSLGIIIGVAAVYAMLALGEGAKKQIEESLNSISTRTMQVWPDWNRRRSSQSRPSMPFTEQDIIEMESMPPQARWQDEVTRSRRTRMMSAGISLASIRIS